MDGSVRDAILIQQRNPKWNRLELGESATLSSASHLCLISILVDMKKIR